jgi:L-fuconolactonase
MLKIDAHQHFWKYNPVRDSWINDDLQILRNDFLPEDLSPILKSAGFDGCITVQSNQSEAENDFQLQNAEVNSFIKGVVGWLDLQADNLDEKLAHFSQFEKFKGIRHILQGEAQRDFMLRPAFLKGISKLNHYNQTYDILIYPDQLTYTKTFVAKFPDQPFVINHLAKPDIKNRHIDTWKKEMEEIANYENVYCKLSGMVTETDWKNWKPDDFTPYLDVVVKAFGTERLMFGSDWPVCNVAGKFQQVVEIISNYLKSFTQNEQSQIFGGNAIRFYHIIES